MTTIMIYSICNIITFSFVKNILMDQFKIVSKDLSMISLFGKTKMEHLLIYLFVVSN